MARTPMWRRYLRFWGPNPKADVDAEIAFHLEELVRHYEARGLSLKEAQAVAARRFGDAARVRAECTVMDESLKRAVKRRELADALRHDLRDGWRGMARNPGFTIGAALILALGIGFNTTVYSFNKALLFPDVPIGDAREVVRLWAQNMTRGVFAIPLSEGEVADVTVATRLFESLAAYSVQPMTLTGGTGAERVLAIRATTNLFRVLQVSPLAGRDFGPDDGMMDGSQAAIVSYRTWQTRFASDPAAIGSVLHLDGRPHTIVGVMPEGFWFESRDVEVWLPMAPPRADGRRDARTLLTVARLDSRVSPQAAQSDVQTVARQLAKHHPETNAGWEILVTGLLPLGPGEKVFFALVGTLTGLLLAAACAHIANLLLARGLERRGEIAIRTAIGAARGRIVRQLLVESVALSALGGGCSLVVAFWIVAQIRTLLGPRTPFLAELSLDAGALAVTGGLVIAASALFGLAPALRLSSVAAADAMRQPPGGPIAGRPKRRLANLLIGLEVAVATLALIMSGLYARATSNVFAIPLGFEADGVVTFRIDVPEYKYPGPDAATRVLGRIHQRVQNLPSIGAAGASIRLPHNLGPGVPPEPITADGGHDVSPEQGPWAITSVVTPGYFEALRIPVVQGRSFDARDVAGAQPVAMISRSTARAYWPDKEVVGHRVKMGGADAPTPWLTVIGVVEDVRPPDPTSPQVRQLYVPLEQAPVRALTYFVAGEGTPANRFEEVRQAVRDVDPELPVLDLRTLSDVMADVLSGVELGQRSIWVNALIAIVLAVTGVYSVVAFASARRRREIAIRVAVGGTRSRIVAMLLGEAFRPVLVGLAVGVVVSGLVSRVTALVLFGVDPLDPLTYGLAVVGLCGAAAAASWFPAVRATRMSVSTALRSE